MANNIKGITIEIGGNTTKLTEALSNVNKDVRGTQEELKEVNKLLKLDPTNTEALAQKQQLLGHLSMIFDAKWQNFCVRKIPMPMLV